jgi:hypothetical protein
MVDVEESADRVTFVLVGDVDHPPAWARAPLRVEIHPTMEHLSGGDPRIADMIRLYDPNRGLQRRRDEARRLIRAQG